MCIVKVKVNFVQYTVLLYSLEFSPELKCGDIVLRLVSVIGNPALTHLNCPLVHYTVQTGHNNGKQRTAAAERYLVVRSLVSCVS